MVGECRMNITMSFMRGRLSWRMPWFCNKSPFYKGRNTDLPSAHRFLYFLVNRKKLCKNLHTYICSKNGFNPFSKFSFSYFQPLSVTENIRATSRMFVYGMSHSPEKTVRKEWLKNIHVLEYKGSEEPPVRLWDPKKLSWENRMVWVGTY